MTVPPGRTARLSPDQAQGAPVSASAVEPALLRRLDWRFLLPEPLPDRLLYVGRGQDSLLSALQSQVSVVRASTPETLADGFASGGPPEPFDLVVVQGLGAAELSQIAALVRPGGWLYGEMVGWSRARLAMNEASLARAGFGDLDWHWHYPDFERCRRVLSPDDPTAVAYVMSGARGPKRWIEPATRSLSKRKLLGRVAPCVSFLARRTAIKVIES